MNDEQDFQETLAAWLSALKAGTPHDELTRKVASLIAQHEDEALTELFATLNPTEVEANEADLDFERWLLEDSATDSPLEPIASHLDFSFMTFAEESAVPVKSSNWLHEIKNAMRDGTQWTFDSLDALCLGFNLQTGIPSPSAWPTKADGEPRLLFQYEFEQSEVTEWIVEVSAFVDGKKLYRIEVALLRPNLIGVNLAGIPIEIVTDTMGMTEQSDEGGVAEFVGLPLDELGTIFLRIAFPN